jgi:catechol 2,3-dioxygenase-like lactoylglutathione lyase family enzyme/RimJ/RimL family protein N-acetyltransferase
MLTNRIDHLVLTVADIERSVEFYQSVMGMTRVEFGADRVALCFGKQKINLHQSGREFEPKAGKVQPGSADLCFIIDDPVDQAIAELQAQGIDIIDGLVKRTGARGEIVSAYFRDPDDNLIEISNYIDGYQIKTGYIPGLVGRVAEMHASYYARHWNFTNFFETRVASEMSVFINRYDAERDCSWSALIDNSIVASITIDGIDAASKGAHLRWFIASDAVRGKGIGGRLIALAMDFCRQKGYDRVYLHTFKGLDAAQHLYESVGFKLMETQSGDQWGTRVDEQRYEARLQA